MTTSDAILIHTDGAARGNPGPASFAYVIQRAGHPPLEDAGRLGSMTNNQAEYVALVRALEQAAKLGPGRRVTVFSDSELMVKQMRGEYRVKNPDLRDLYEQAVDQVRAFAHVDFRHVRRENNRRADQLCNDALDGRLGQSLNDGTPPDDGPEASGVASPASTAPAAVAATPAARRKAAWHEATGCLREAATAWARGNPDDPAAEDVWEQIWGILEAHEQVRERGRKRRA